MSLPRSLFARLGLFFCLVCVTTLSQAEETSLKKGEHGISAASAANVEVLPQGRGLARRLKLTYFTFFRGPGIRNDFFSTPNMLGKKADKGWVAKTHLSVGYRVTERIAIDYQLKIDQVVSHQYDFQNEGGKLGISGVLLRGRDWDLKGAFNSDIPGLGESNVQKTLILSPGLFARLHYRPSGSRWSLYTLVRPRVYFYRDRMAMDEVSLDGGFKPGDKPLVELEFEPTLNYALSEKAGLRAGVDLDWRQNANSDSLKRWFWPVDFGYTYAFSEKLKIYPNIRFSTPLDDELRAKKQVATNWLDTFSFGFWVNGAIL